MCVKVVTYANAPTPHRSTGDSFEPAIMWVTGGLEGRKLETCPTKSRRHLTMGGSILLRQPRMRGITVGLDDVLLVSFGRDGTSSARESGAVGHPSAPSGLRSTLLLWTPTPAGPGSPSDGTQSSRADDRTPRSQHSTTYFCQQLRLRPRGCFICV